MREASFSLIAFCLGLCLRLLFVARLPGLHYDEAWAANFAVRIANEPGFWPFDAMSPYTHPWSHYLTAGFFKIFGVHLWVSRVAGLAMASTGLFLIWKSLRKIGEASSAPFFAFLAAVFVPMVADERFAIELNTFHVLCLGVFVYGVCARRWTLIAASSILGTTSHILFLAPVLSAFVVWVLSRENKPLLKDRKWIGAICLALMPFFFKILLQIPEKEKALALVLINLAVLAYVSLVDTAPSWPTRLDRWLKWPVLIVTSVFAIYIFLMSEGSWSMLLTHGVLLHSWMLFITFPVVVAGWFFIASEARILLPSWPSHFLKWSIYTLFLVGLMSTKPTPRYFEMAFSLAMVAVSLTLSRIPRKTAALFLTIFIAVSVLEWALNYVSPSLQHETRERSFRFLIFHDNSSDSLPKQDLVAALGQMGCGREQVVTHDARLDEALRFLSFGDWPVDRSKTCPAAQVKVERVEGSMGGRQRQRVGQFKLAY